MLSFSRYRQKSFQDYFFFQAADGIRDTSVTGVQTCALPICAIFKSVDKIFTPFGKVVFPQDLVHADPAFLLFLAFLDEHLEPQGGDSICDIIIIDRLNDSKGA